MKQTNRTTAPAINQPSFPSIALPKSEVIDGITGTFINAIEPLSRLDIVFNYGTLQQQQQATVSASLNLALSGTESLNQKAILSKLEYFGVFTDFTASSNHSILSIYSTPDHIKKATDFILECLTKCSFPSQELELYKQAKTSQLKQKRDKTSYLATTELNKAFFKDEHIKNPVTEEDYHALTSDELKRQLTNICGVKKALYLVSNTNDLADLTDIVLKHVPQGTKENNDQNSYSNLPFIKHIHHDKAVQTSFRMRFPLIGKSHKDYPAIVMVNTMLGGYFGSLLMKNIREDRGLTYGINSQIVADKSKGSIFIGTDIKQNTAPLVLKEIKKELQRIKSGEITPEFFSKSRNYLKGITAKKNDEIFSRLEIVKTLQMNNLSYDFYPNLYKRINELTIEKCTEAAQKHLKTEKSVVVTCGPEQYETTDFV